MKVTLQIKKENLDLIKSGVKKSEWRSPSLFNKNKLFKFREDGKRIGNDEIKQIEFINGYSKDAERCVIGVKEIRMVRFSKDVEIKEDNFSAKEGQFAIQIIFE